MWAPGAGLPGRLSEPAAVCCDSTGCAALKLNTERERGMDKERKARGKRERGEGEREI